MSRYEGPKINMNVNLVKGVAIGIVALIVIGVMASAAVQIVDAGHRGVLLHWNAVDVTAPPLDEGLHFVVPFQDTVVNMEVRTLLFVKGTSSASKDLHPEVEQLHQLHSNVVKRLCGLRLLFVLLRTPSLQ